MKDKLLHQLWRYFKIILGGAIFAIGFRKFLYPNSIMTGGLTGVAMILNKLIGVPVGTTSLVLNIPLFIMARKVQGRRYFVGSIFGMASSSLFVDLFGEILPDFTRDPLLGTLYGGLIVGLGIGLVLSCSAGTGGTDMVAGLLRRKFPGVNMGRLIMIVDFAVIVVFAAIFRNFDSAMYSVVAIFISGKVMDGMLYGFEFSKLAYIISDKYGEISKKLQTEMKRGVTLLSGQGAYTGNDKKVILCAIKKQQIVRLKRIVRECDENAFVIISDAREVLGSGFESFEDDI